jgi:hypothetical protein
MWYEFSQNNSGGSFTIDPRDGLGPRVWIEAESADDANDRAESLGIYFNGCDREIDCDCCGDRWYSQYRNDGHYHPTVSVQYDFNWHNEVYIHPLDAPFFAVTVDNYNEVLAQYGTVQGTA